ncbi:beta-ketoacyl synthase N-terminal-like domain-containing protein [Actinophytocola sp.]|uniref:beta-ketoacyl synthase N-terminal-like domain-containing protein n=1 Tax=Actinophytocola sp. TaxID=1872138 RepID=UPI003D6BA242
MPEYDPADALADVLAVVGIALRAPMARDHHEFWSNILAGRECLSLVDSETTPGWVPVKGVLDGADEFDADFFGFSPREAEITDPQQRVFLQLVWHAIEDAGHTPSTCGRVGVFASATQSRYAELLDAAVVDSVGDLPVRIATESDFLATRVAYKLNLRGPALTVQTACSSSLVAVHLAAGALLAGDCDTAIAGGVTITLPLRCGYRHQTGSILSPDGHCRVFDAAAEGTVPGNGGAAVVLRRLDDALADGDAVYATLLGSAVNNDGMHKIGFTAPSGAGQRAAIETALRAAGVDADQVGLIEAHGTATALGDPVEVGALREVLGAGRADGSWCGLSATKSNIGHLDAAAGIVGFVKAVLAVEAGVVPPTAGFQRPNPDLLLEASPLRVVRTPMAWPVPGRRIAGVSAFGVGGTNAHAVIAQAPHRPPSGPEPERVALALSARTPDALAELSVTIADFLSTRPAVPLADVAHTLRVGRVTQPCQRVVAGSDREELIAVLRGDASPQAPDQVDTGGSGRRVHLPGYPFQCRRYWPSSGSPGHHVGWIEQIFADLLGRTPDSETQSFFDLGGDSLMAVQLISRIGAATGVEPDLERFLDEPTMAGLAALLDEAAR